MWVYFQHQRAFPYDFEEPTSEEDVDIGFSEFQHPSASPTSSLRSLSATACQKALSLLWEFILWGNCEAANEQLARLNRAFFATTKLFLRLSWDAGSTTLLGIG